jgi:hypothetical protein
MALTTTRLRRAGLVAALGLALSGCGDGENDVTLGPPAPSAPDLRGDYTAMLARMSAPNIFNTAFLPPDNAIPASGSATFTGFANVTVTQPGGPLTLTGPATVAIDFGSRDLTGSATGFSGVEGTTVSAYAGTIAFENGRIGRDETPPTVQQPNDVRLDYAGTLTGDGNTVVLDGSASGKLKGSPIRGLNVTAPVGETVRLNGSSAPSTFTLVAEKD